MQVDPESMTWKAVAFHVEQLRQHAIDDLIADRNSERARGALETLDKLAGLGRSTPLPLVMCDDYT